MPSSRKFSPLEKARKNVLKLSVRNSKNSLPQAPIGNLVIDQKFRNRIHVAPSAQIASRVLAAHHCTAKRETAAESLIRLPHCCQAFGRRA